MFYEYHLDAHKIEADHFNRETDRDIRADKIKENNHTFMMTCL